MEKICSILSPPPPPSSLVVNKRREIRISVKYTVVQFTAPFPLHSIDILILFV